MLMDKLDRLLQKAETLPKLIECYDYDRLTESELKELSGFCMIEINGGELSSDQLKRKQIILDPVLSTTTKNPCGRYDNLTDEELEELIEIYSSLLTD